MAKSLDATVLDAVPIAILVLGMDDRIEKANAASGQFFGDNTENRLVSDVIRHPDFHNALALSKALRSPGRARFTLNTLSGSVTLEAQITPLADEHGVTVAFEDQTAMDQAAAIRLAGDKLYHVHACGNDRGAPGFDGAPAGEVA